MRAFLFRFGLGVCLYCVSPIQVVIANNTVAPSNPEYVIAAYVQALQVGNTQTLGKVADPFLFQYVMLQTAGDGRYPILSQLGQIRDIIIQPESNAIGLTVQIQHELGTSEWQFMFGEARFALSSAYLKRVTFFNQNPYDYYTGGIFGGNNSLIRKPSAIWEQRTESSGSILGQLPGGGENYHTQSNLRHSLPDPQSLQHLHPPLGFKRASKILALDTHSVVEQRQGLLLMISRLVEFLFATDRIPQNGPQAVSFGGDRQSSLTFGAVSVHIPKHHRIGRIELPQQWKFWGFELYHEPLDEKKHFVIRQLQIVPIRRVEPIDPPNASNARVDICSWF